jgi:hypothetical protein
VGIDHLSMPSTANNHRMACQVGFHSFVFVRPLFIVTLSCGFLSDVRPLFALARYLLVLWRW